VIKFLRQLLIGSASKQQFIDQTTALLLTGIT